MNNMTKNCAFVAALLVMILFWNETKYNGSLLLELSMFLQNKNMILFKSEDGGNPTYDTLLFGGRPDYFVKNATLPTNLEEYIALNLNTTIERTLYGY